MPFFHTFFYLVYKQTKKKVFIVENSSTTIFLSTMTVKEDSRNDVKQNFFLPTKQLKRK